MRLVRLASELYSRSDASNNELDDDGAGHGNIENPRITPALSIKPTDAQQAARQIAILDDYGYDLLLRFTRPEFNTKEIRDKFEAHKVSQYNLPMCIFCFFVGTFHLSIRANLVGLWFHPSPCFYLGFFTAASFVILLSFVMLIRAAVNSDWHVLLRPLRPYKDRAEAFSRTRAATLMQDGVLFFLTLTAAFYNLARTLAGPCDASDLNWYDTQKCNPYAGVHWTPIEQTVTCLLAILLFQVRLANGIRSSFVRFVLILTYVLILRFASKAPVMSVYSSAGSLTSSWLTCHSPLLTRAKPTFGRTLGLLRHFVCRMKASGWW